MALHTLYPLLFNWLLSLPRYVVWMEVLKNRSRGNYLAMQLISARYRFHRWKLVGVIESGGEILLLRKLIYLSGPEEGCYQIARENHKPSLIVGILVTWAVLTKGLQLREVIRNFVSSAQTTSGEDLMFKYFARINISDGPSVRKVALTLLRHQND